MSGIASVLFLCTGNATRSVLAGELLRQRRPDLAVGTAGPLSGGAPPLSFAAADPSVRLLIVGLAPEHGRWVRREHPAHAARAATLVRLDRTEHALPSWVSSGAAAQVDLADWEEVVDPGGGDVDAFVSCARQIVELIDRVAPRL